MSIRMALLGGLAVAALFAQPASAQTLYRSVGPDGRVTYSDKPPADAVKTEKKEIDTSRRGIAPPTAGEKATLRQLESDRKARESAADRVRRAEIALHDAEVAREMGKEPQPGERQGTAGGSSRFTDSYFQRQKRLEDAVTQARQNLARARDGK